MLKPFLYYLIESDGRVRSIQNGLVVSTNRKIPLMNSPAGWSDILVRWQRNTERHGQVRNFSLPLGFVKDGARILRNDMYTTNIDRELYLLIQKLASIIDATTYTERYMFFYKGQLDFSTFEDDPGGSMVNINIMEGGISKLVKANENTQYFLPFDEDAINITNDGVKLDERHNFIAQSGGYASDDLLGILFINKEGAAFGVATYSIYKQNEPSDLTTSLEFFLATAQSISGLRLKGSINTISIINGDYTLKLKSSLGQDITMGTISGVGTMEFDQVFDGSPNEHFFITLESNFAVIAELGETDITLSYTSRKDATNMPAFLPFDVYMKLCIKLGIEPSKVISTLLRACTYALTSGDGIRGIAGAGIKTSINDFFKAYNIYLFAGWDIRNITEIETRYKYYDATDPIILGKCRDMKIQPATDMIFSSIEVGHAEQQVDDVNGKYDFNGKLIYTTPVKAGGGKKYDLVSPYKAGPYEIETIRINLEGKTTTDATQDNTVFVIDVAGGVSILTRTVSFVAAFFGFTTNNTSSLANGQRIKITGSANNDGEYVISAIAFILITTIVLITGLTTTTDEPLVSVTIEILKGQVYTLDRSVVPTSGVPSPDTIFNVRLRPAALLELHYSWIASFLYNYSGVLKFEQANRNGDLVVGGVKDGRDIDISTLGAIIFKPYYFNFITKVPIDLVESLATAPNKSFTTDWEEDDYTGFLIDAGIAPNTRQPQQYKLLCAPDVDITKLIV